MARTIFGHLVEEKDLNKPRGKGNANTNLNSLSFDNWTPVQELGSGGGTGATDIIYQQTFGNSSVQIQGSADIIATYSGGHLTITVPLNKSLKRMSVLLSPTEMVYTDGSFIIQNGFLITVNTHANGSTPLAFSPQVFKKIFGGLISASNPLQALNPMDTNMMILYYSSGVVDYAWNDLQANLPNGGLITF